MGEGRRIDDDARTVLARLMNPIDDLVFPVALMKTEFMAEFGCQFSEKFNLKLLQPPKPTTKAPSVMTPSFLTAKDEAAGDK